MAQHKLLDFDRTDFTPPHEGPKVLPNTPFFSALIRHAHVENRISIRDVNLGNREWTYSELLSDVLKLRSRLAVHLPKDILQEVRRPDSEMCIGVLAAGGYEYVVGILCVLALGFAAVPMTVVLPVNEACYFVKKSKQVALLASKGAEPLARGIVQKINEERGSMKLKNFAILDDKDEDGECIDVRSISLSSDRYLSDNAAGLVIFTSGTTGPPKGAVLRRGYIHEASRTVAFHFGLTPSDTLLNLLPVHHVTGLAINVLPFLITGACIEFRSGGFDPKWTWERFRLISTAAASNRLTIFSGVPTIYMRLMRYYQANLENLLPSEREPYEHGIRSLRVMMCGTSALPRPVAQFWERIRQGKKILTRYGSTEIGAVLRVPADDTNVPEGSVGKVAPGSEIKLMDVDTGKEADEGEVWVKTPELFSKYLDDVEATRKSFTKDGWFKTGDIARREGLWYWIVGRASQDIIKSGGYKISALDVEREILALPYVNEVSVMGVQDEEFGERVAALLTIIQDRGKDMVTLSELRADLKSQMAGYKMPTLLRIVSGELPKTASGKVLKKVLGRQLFPQPGWEKEEAVQVWRRPDTKI